MKVLVSYIEGGETKVDGPFLSNIELVAGIESLERRGIFNVRLTRQDIVCDFCSDPHPVWLFSIVPGGEVSNGNMDSDGKWAACEPCADFIRKNDPVGTLRRSVEAAQKLYPDTLGKLALPALASVLAEPHALFWSLYDGSDPEAIPQDDEILGVK